MIGFANAVKDDMLAVFAGQTLSLALYTGDREISDRGYERQPVTFGSPKGQDARYVENTDYVRFAPLTAAHQIDHWAVFEGNELRARYKLQRARELPAEDSPVFLPGALRIGVL